MVDVRRKVAAMNEKNFELRSQKARIQLDMKELEELMASSESKLEDLRRKARRLDESIEQNEAAQVELFYSRRESGVEPNPSLVSASSVAQRTPSATKPPLADLKRCESAMSTGRATTARITPVQRPGFVLCQNDERGPILTHDHVKTYSSNRLNLSADHPTIVKLNGGWAEIFCHICGANASQSRNAFFNGLKGLCVHYARTHKDSFRKLQIEDIPKICGTHFLTQEEYLACCQHKLNVKKVYGPLREAGMTDLSATATNELDDATIVEETHATGKRSRSRLLGRRAKQDSESGSEDSDADATSVISRIKRRRMTEDSECIRYIEHEV